MSCAQFHCCAINEVRMPGGWGCRKLLRKCPLSRQMVSLWSQGSAALSSLCASRPYPQGAAPWPWPCGVFMKAFLQLVEGGGHMGRSLEEKGVGFLFSLWLRHVGEHFCRILLIHNLFTLTPRRLPSVRVRIQGERHWSLRFRCGENHVFWIWLVLPAISELEGTILRGPNRMLYRWRHLGQERSTDFAEWHS